MKHNAYCMKKHLQHRFLVLIIFVLLPVTLRAQVNRADFIIHVHKTHQPIRIDGLLDEPGWA